MIYKSPRCFLASLESIGLSVQEEKRKIDFPDGWWPSWIFDRHDFSYFFIYKSPRCFLASLESIGLLVQEKKRKIDFQDGGHGSHLGFLIGMILAIFDLQWSRSVGGVGF